MAGARGRAARGVRDVPARHVLPVARGGAEALRARTRSTRCTAAARSPTSSTSRTRSTRSRSRSRRTSTGRCRRRRSRKSRSRRRRPRSSRTSRRHQPCAEPGRGRSRAESPRQRRAAGRRRSSCRCCAWCAISYLPFLWHPMVRVTDPGDVAWMTPGMLVERAAFAAENAEVAARSGRPADGVPANPDLPARAARGGARARHRLHHAARRARGAVAAPEPVAQHPGDLLGLPALVAARRAARASCAAPCPRWRG